MGMKTATKVSRSDKALKPIIAACYPEWKGRKLSVKPATQYQMMNYWDGGSRCYVVAYDLATSSVVDTAGAAKIPYNDLAHAVVSVPDGVLLVEHSIFCGKDAGITIYANPANMPRLLTEAE